MATYYKSVTVGLTMDINDTFDYGMGIYTNLKVDTTIHKKINRVIATTLKIVSLANKKINSVVSITFEIGLLAHKKIKRIINTALKITSNIIKKLPFLKFYAAAKAFIFYKNKGE